MAIPMSRVTVTNVWCTGFGDVHVSQKDFDWIAVPVSNCMKTLYLAGGDASECSQLLATPLYILYISLKPQVLMPMQNYVTFGIPLIKQPRDIK